MSIPGAYIALPQLYTAAQLDLACQVEHVLNRGKFVLAVQPAR